MFPSRIPDPWSKRRIRILIKKFKHFWHRSWIYDQGCLQRIPDPGSGFFSIQDPQIQGSKKHPDPESATLVDTTCHGKFVPILHYLQISSTRMPKILDIFIFWLRLYKFLLYKGTVTNYKIHNFPITLNIRVPTLTPPPPPPEPHQDHIQRCRVTKEHFLFSLLWV